MCFSATASFETGAALSATGVVTIKKTKAKKELPFAAIPLLFGAQQFTEGGVWLSLQYGLPFVNQVATYAYMLIAYVLWPVFVPFSVRLIETDPDRKRILTVFQLLGVAVSLYLLYFIVRYPMSSGVVCKSIVYTMPKSVLPVTLYLFATSVSCLFSSHRIVNVLGVLGTLSLAAAYYFYTVSFVSSWCFFAAVLSAVIYWYFRK